MVDCVITSQVGADTNKEQTTLISKAFDCIYFLSCSSYARGQNLLWRLQQEKRPEGKPKKRQHLFILLFV